MRTIFSNGVNVELAYHETKVKFGDVEYTTKRQLVLNLLCHVGKEYIPTCKYFDLDDDSDIYGEIYDGGEHLSLFRATDEFLMDVDVEQADILAMLEGIRNFRIRLVKDFTNKEFADKMDAVIGYRLNEE